MEIIIIIALLALSFWLMFLESKWFEQWYIKQAKSQNQKEFKEVDVNARQKRNRSTKEVLETEGKEERKKIRKLLRRKVAVERDREPLWSCEGKGADTGCGLPTRSTLPAPAKWRLNMEIIEIIIWALLATAIFICLLLLLWSDMPIGVIVAL